MKMNKTTILAGLAVAGLATGLSRLGFGVAQAVTAIPPGTLHGCVSGPGRTLQRVSTNPSSGTTCPSGSFQVVWPNGPDSDTSSSVTAGPAGLDVVVVSAGTSADVAAECPVSHPFVLGGGYAGAGVVTDMPRSPSPPFKSTANTGAWIVQGPPGSAVGACAICAK